MATSKKTGKAASKVLRDPKATTNAKKVAGSVLGRMPDNKDKGSR